MNLVLKFCIIQAVTNKLFDIAAGQVAESIRDNEFPKIRNAVGKILYDAGKRVSTKTPGEIAKEIL